jgi:hypothetical protein
MYVPFPVQGNGQRPALHGLESFVLSREYQASSTSLPVHPLKTCRVLRRCMPVTHQISQYQAQTVHTVLYLHRIHSCRFMASTPWPTTNVPPYVPADTLCRERPTDLGLSATASLLAPGSRWILRVSVRVSNPTVDGLLHCRGGFSSGLWLSIFQGRIKTF